MTKPPRPQSVTSACLFVGISCLLLLWFVSGWLTSWNSLAVQDGLRSTLDEIDLGLLGTTTQGVIDGLRTVLMVSVVPLVAGVVFAVYAARGHRSSRVLLTVIAVVAALAFVVTGGFVGLLPAAFAVAAVVRLWSRESRVWFDVVNGREPSVAPQQVASSPVAPALTGPVPEGTQTAVLAQSPVRMPSPVRTLVIVTSIASGLATSASVIYLAVYALARDQVIEAQLDSPFRSMLDSTDQEIVDAMRLTATICAITVVLGVAALVAAWGVTRRSGLGHLALTVLSGVTIILGLFTLVGVPWAAVAIWVLVLLRQRESRTWVAAA